MSHVLAFTEWIITLSVVKEERPFGDENRKHSSTVLPLNTNKEAYTDTSAFMKYSDLKVFPTDITVTGLLSHNVCFVHWFVGLCVLL